MRHVPVDSTIEFVILASDGLWKVSYYGSLWMTNCSAILYFLSSFSLSSSSYPRICQNIGMLRFKCLILPNGVRF